MSIPQSPAPSPAPANLAFLPPELLLKIFSHLDPGNSICLGLASKRLYPIHRSLHGAVRLETRVVAPFSPAPGPRLYELLEEWHAPGFEMCWCGQATVRTARTEFGVKTEEGRGWEKCVKCRIVVFSKSQLRVNMRWVYHSAYGKTESS